MEDHVTQMCSNLFDKNENKIDVNIVATVYLSAFEISAYLKNAQITQAQILNSLQNTSTIYQAMTTQEKKFHTTSEKSKDVIGIFRRQQRKWSPPCEKSKQQFFCRAKKFLTRSNFHVSHLYRGAFYLYLPCARLL